MSDRPPRLTVAVADQNGGKTYVTLQVCDLALLGNRQFNVLPQRILIFDVNGEFPQVRTLPLNMVPLFSQYPYYAKDFPETHKPLHNNPKNRYPFECRRVTPFKSDGTLMTSDELQIALGYLLNHFKNGIFVGEDFSTYNDNGKIKMDIATKLLNKRHRNLDIIFHVQSKSLASNPTFMRNNPIIRLHKTSDRIEHSADNFVGHVEILMIAEKLVELENERRPKDKQWFFCYVDTSKHSIRGDFDFEMYEHAFDEYIHENTNITIQPILRRVDPSTGKKQYTVPTAIAEYKKKNLMKYYGNE